MEQSVDAVSVNTEGSHPGLLKVFVLTLIGLGLIVSGYLLSHYQGLLSATLGKGMDVCSTVFGAGCETALISSVSSQLGIPLAGWGLIYYSILFVFLFIGWFFREEFKIEALLAVFVLSLGACVVSIMLLALMIADPALFCPLCTVLHVVNLALFFTLAKMSGYSPSQMLDMLKDRAKALFQGRTAEANNSWKLLGFVTVALIALTIYQGIRVVAGPAGQPLHTAFQADQLLAEFVAQTKNEIPVDKDDAMLGPDGAPVQLIVFSDFLCPACGYFSTVVEDLNKQYPGKLQVVFKHFPLGTACNPYMSSDIHPRACEAAWASEAARQQGQFWQYHDALFSADLKNGKGTVSSIARSLGLDQQRFDSFRSNKAVKEKVERTILQAIRLEVDATPAVFLNGRRVHDLSTSALGALIDHEAGQDFNQFGKVGAN